MKKNNFISFILLFALLIISSVFLVQAAAYNAPQLQVTLLSQTPDPVEPGQVVKLKFKIENLGAESSTDNIVKIIPKAPFSLYGDVAEKNPGKLRASQTGADAAIIEYNLKIDETAVEGETEIELMIKNSQDAWLSYTNSDFLVNIQTRDAVLDITKTVMNPDPISPGGTAEITFTVKNLASTLLKDIKFRTEFDSTTPFAPYQSSSERRIPQLQSNYQLPLTFKIIADPEAKAGLYKVPLNITYNDEKGNSYQVKDFLAIVIGEKPQLQTYIKKSSVLQANQAGAITLEMANAGTNDLKFVELTILPSNDFQFISSSNYFYIGNIDSDDTGSEDLNIFVNKKVKILHLPIQLKYRDANNKPYQQQFNLEINIYSSSQLRKFGLLAKSNVWVYGLILIFIGGAYLLYRRYKNSKAKR